VSSSKIIVIETRAEDEEKVQESFSESQGKGVPGGCSGRQDDGRTG